ncbi:NUDIX hydrolase domain-like protein [Halteromyces radiatus]|uniref:NUDIX hydrolase domain-like protein n=1 Tax=Halteromyces radiatus TaxID=101107 RepID=UPI00222040F6|nr:NUDIX hydrolase domain-like protein [Halteromyces radiatus]KAI8089486.1 NUDIX hydrolase domain-like protein [Halteromyces radiatus]
MVFANYLQVVQHCDSVTYNKDQQGIPFQLEDGTVVGTLLPRVVTALITYNNTMTPSPFLISGTHVQFNTHVTNMVERTQEVATLMTQWRKDKVFPALAGWRDELYAVYGPGGVPAFVMERAATPLFGISTFGVHINVFGRDQDTIKMWVARRSLTKQTWPGLLDNCVAGGIPYTYSTKETVIKECDEEASIPASIAAHAKSTGAVSYYTMSEHGLQPETEYVYDLELPTDCQPTPKDGEVECFYFWTLDQVKDSILKGDWKPNCALVAIDFMIRHGHITPDNEPDFIDIMYHLHRKLEFPSPKKTLEIKHQP